MNNISNLMNFSDTFNNEDIKPIMDLIDSIMSISEEQLKDERIVEAYKSIISETMKIVVTEEAIQTLIKNYEMDGYNRKQLITMYDDLRASFEQTIEELEPSQAKRKLLKITFNSFNAIFDKIIERYHTYDIELPIMLDEGARMPMYAHESDACADVYALEDTVVRAHTLGNKIRTGLHFGTPENWQIGVLPRSSIGYKTPLRLSNSRAVIDEDFRDELMILYDNISDSDYEIKAGDRIAQMFVTPTYRFKGVIVGTLDGIGNDRGGGLGSTGT